MKHEAPHIWSCHHHRCSLGIRPSPHPCRRETLGERKRERREKLTDPHSQSCRSSPTRISSTSFICSTPTLMGSRTSYSLSPPSGVSVVSNMTDMKLRDDLKDGRYSQVVSNMLDMKLRDDLERLKKIRNHRCLRHYWGLRVRGQHTETTGSRGKTVGVSKKY